MPDTIIGTGTLTVAQAAAMLGVSDAFLAELIESGVVPSRRLGADVVVAPGDVTAYKRAADAARLKSLEELSALDQDLGFGY